MTYRALANNPKPVLLPPPFEIAKRSSDTASQDSARTGAAPPVVSNGFIPVPSLAPRRAPPGRRRRRHPHEIPGPGKLGAPANHSEGLGDACLRRAAAPLAGARRGAPKARARAGAAALFSHRDARAPAALLAGRRQQERRRRRDPAAPGRRRQLRAERRAPLPAAQLAAVDAPRAAPCRILFMVSRRWRRGAVVSPRWRRGRSSRGVASMVWRWQR